MPPNFVQLKPAMNTKAYLDRLLTLAKRKAPTLFKLRCRLPAVGRIDMPVAATSNLNIVLKTYATGGENAVHAHTAEDHAFIVLQGEATFFDKAGRVTGKVQKHEGILIPNNVFYRFQAGEREPLVLLRVSAILPHATLHTDDTINAKGKPLDSYSSENKEVTIRYSKNFFGL